MKHCRVQLTNIALVYQGKIISIKIATNRREMICRKLHWRKLYGPKFRQCQCEVNFNQK